MRKKKSIFFCSIHKKFYICIVKYINYIPKNLKLVGYTIFGNEVRISRTGRFYEFSDDYIISYNKSERPIPALGKYY